MQVGISRGFQTQRAGLQNMYEHLSQANATGIAVYDISLPVHRSALG